MPFIAVVLNLLKHISLLWTSKWNTVREGNVWCCVAMGGEWGGTIASIATVILLKNATFGKDRIVCYTFGSPYFASEKFAETLNTVGDSTSLENWAHPDDVGPDLLFQTCASGLTYVPVGSTYNVQSGKTPISETSEIRLTGAARKVRAAGKKHSSVTGNQIHRMKTYFDLLQKCVKVKPQLHATETFKDCDVVNVPYETKNIQELWEPHFSDIMRIGFEDGNRIRFEILGRRLGSILPLSLGDVSLVGHNGEHHRITEACLISVSSMALSYYFSVSYRSPKGERPMKLKLVFRSTFLSSEMVKEIDVEQDWFQNRQRRIEQGSYMDLLAHTRALQLLSINRKNQVKGRPRDIHDASQHSGSSKKKPDNGEHVISAMETLAIAKKMDDFLVSSNINKQEEEEMAEIFRVLDLPQQDRSKVLCELTLSMVAALTKNQKFQVSTVTSRFSSGGDGRTRTTAFTMPLTTNFLSVDVTAAKASTGMYRYEAAIIYITLTKFGSLISKAQNKFRTFNGNVAKLGIGAMFFGFWMLGGPVAVGIVTALDALTCVSVGMVLTFNGFAAIMMQRRLGSHVSCAIAEKFILSTLVKEKCSSGGYNSNSLQSHELTLLKQMQLVRVSDDTGKSVVGDEALEDLRTEDRGEIVSFARNYVDPILSLRLHLAKKSVFTIAVVGEPGSGKTSFVANACRQQYHERTTEQQTYVIRVQTLDGTETLVNVLDFPGMNGNDTFAGADVSNLVAMLPAVDCILFFIKLNSRCFPAKKLLDKVRKTCKVRIVLSHVDCVLRNKVIAMEDQAMWEEGDDDAPLFLGSDGEDDDLDDDNVLERRSMIVDECMESLVMDKTQICNKHCIPLTDAVFWAPTSALRDLQPLYRNALTPHMQSTKQFAKWLVELVY